MLGARSIGAAVAGAAAGVCSIAGDPGRGGVPSGGTAGTGGSGATGTSFPVAGAGSGGTSRLTDAAPSAGPIAAWRRLTDCSTKLLSTLAPTAYARGGLPSTEISATPWREGLAVMGRLGAITPYKRKRDAAAGDKVAAATDAAGAAPNKRVRSPRVVAAGLIATECAGALGARTSSFSDQNTTPPATRAQTMKAASRATIV